MANPRTRFLTRPRELLELARAAPSMIERVEKYLERRDQDICDAVDAGLRKTVSREAQGDGSGITSINPVWTPVSLPVSVITEKVHDQSRMEIDASVYGEATVGPLILHMGVRFTSDDGAAIGPTNYKLGQGAVAAGALASLTVHNFVDPALTTIPSGRYLFQLILTTLAGGTWTQRVDTSMSMRVTESLY